MTTTIALWAGYVPSGSSRVEQPRPSVPLRVDLFEDVLPQGRLGGASLSVLRIGMEPWRPTGRPASAAHVPEPPFRGCRWRRKGLGFP